MAVDAWGNVVALFGILVPALLLWVTIAREQRNDLSKLADLAAVQEALDADGRADNQVKEQIKESIRVLTAKVAFREYGKITGKRVANDSLRERFVIPLSVVCLFYGASALGIVASSVWNPVWLDHHLRFWAFLAFFVTLTVLLIFAVILLVHRNNILRKFESALQAGTERDFLQAHSPEVPK